jgi:hypothetical protein
LVLSLWEQSVNTAVVIPSIRNINEAYLEPLRGHKFLVIDDSDGNVSKTGWSLDVSVYDYEDRRRILGDSEYLVSKKSPSCKTLGLYIAFKEGYDQCVLLDDDVSLENSPDFLDRNPVGRFVKGLRVDHGSEWVNSTELMSNTEGLYSRGVPYEHRREGKAVVSETPHVARSSFNECMWANTPDINGCDRLREQVLNTGMAVNDPTRTCDKTVFLDKGQLLPLSIMSVCLESKLIPAFYQPPDPVCGRWTIRRHDDVWSGLAVKFLMDRQGDVMSCGQPITLHKKAGDTLRETVSEHVTNLIQPVLLDCFRKADRLMPERVGSYAEEAVRFFELVYKVAANAPGGYAKVIRDYAHLAKTWARLFDR